MEAGDGARLTVVWKDLTPGALLPGARRARATARRPTRRASCAPTSCSTARGLGTPRLIAAVDEPGRAWLFLEAVRGRATGARRRRGGVGGGGALARARARRADRTRAAPTLALAAAAWSPPDLAALAARGDAAPAAAARRPRPALDAARARLAAAPPAVIHGELYAANVLIDAPADRPRLRARLGDDRARTGAARPRGAHRRRMGRPRRAARRGLPPGAARPAAPRAFYADLDAARLLTAARWIAAPADWQPPPEQARDWLRDAEAIAGRIGP